MKQKFFYPWMVLALLSISLRVPAVAQGEDVDAEWDGIQRLQIDLTAHEDTPFVQPGNLKFREPTKASETPPVTRKSVTEVAMKSQSIDQTAAHKSQLRESLAREGQSSLEGRDNLTSEIVSVTKWTIVMLLVGAVVIVGLKKFQSRIPEGSASHRIRILETLQLGRQQGLKLVEVGGERFLIASDQAGIKSVTLLPSWPAMDQEEAAEPRSHVFPGEPRIFKDDDTERAAG